MSINYQYPDYVEKPSIDSSVYQSGEEINWGNKWTIVRRMYIGPDDSILASGYEHRKGTDYDCGHGLSGIVDSCITEKINADRTQMTLNIRCSTSKDSGDPDPDDPLTETWSCTMAQLELPLYCYCSPNYTSVDIDTWGDAVAIQQWENESDAGVKSKYQYWIYDVEKQEDTFHQLEGRSLSIAMMINSGVDSRICFYPQATKTSIYDKRPSSIGSKESALNTIDDSSLEDEDIADWLTTSDYSWLKSGYNLQQNSDDTWTLTETWIGSPKYLGGWRPELYDPIDKWDMWNEVNTQS